MISRLALIIPAVAMLTVPLSADQTSDILEIKKLVLAQAQELQALKARLAELEAEREAVLIAVSEEREVSAPQTASSSPEDAQVIEQPDTEFTLKVAGRVEYDTVFYDNEDGGREYKNGSNFRRARVAVKGTLPGSFEYQIDTDFSRGDAVALDDTFLRYRIDPNTAITFGFHKVFHSLESAASDLDVSFMERHMVSNIFEVGAGGKMGVSILSGGKHWSAQAGVFAGSANSGDSAKDGWGINGRVTWAPIAEEGKLLHLGFAGYYRDEDDDLLNLSDRPEIRHDSFKPFDSGTIAAENYRYGNAEVAGVAGPLSAQFEYGVMATSSSLGDARYDGFSGQVSYFLTGESRPYSANKGAFGQLKPIRPVGQGGYGAFELAARFSHVDLADLGQGSYGDNLTIGVNWYLTDMVRFMLNAVDFHAHGAIEEDGRAYGMRAQVRW